MSFHGKISSGIIAYLLIVAVSGCAESQNPEGKEALLAAAMLTATMAPTQDAVIWHALGNGTYRTFWARGNGVVMDFVLARPHLLIPREGALWEWRETRRKVPVCDCAAWAVIDHQGDCPIDDESFSGKEVVLVDRVSGEEIALVTLPKISDEETIKLEEYFSDAEPIASVGSLLFVREEEKRAYCDRGGEEARQRFFVYNLDTLRREEVFSGSELKKIQENEQVKAYNMVRGDPLNSATSSSDMVLAGIEPHFMGPFNIGLTYHFSSEFSYDEDPPANDADDSRALPVISYFSTVKVRAETIPRLLLENAIPPDVVRLFYTTASPELGRGWTRVAGTPEEMNTLWNTFTEAH